MYPFSTLWKHHENIGNKSINLSSSDSSAFSLSNNSISKFWQIPASLSKHGSLRFHFSYDYLHDEEI